MGDLDIPCGGKVGLTARREMEMSGAQVNVLLGDCWRPRGGRLLHFSHNTRVPCFLATIWRGSHQ